MFTNDKYIEFIGPKINREKNQKHVDENNKFYIFIICKHLIIAIIIFMLFNILNINY
jgi:hypothetical protein